MANRRVTALAQEALAIRARASGPNSDPSWTAVKRRMHELKGLAATSAENNEVRRHVIVATIATLQTFIRFSIVGIVDSGEEYRLRAAERIPEKYSVKDALTLLDDQTLSFGELVAHIASYNSVSRFESISSKGSGSDIGIFSMVPPKSPSLGEVCASLGRRRTERRSCGTHAGNSSIWRDRHDTWASCAGGTMAHFLGRPTYP